MLPYPEIDPIALQIGPLAIRWYALAYILGIVLGYRLVTWLDRKTPQPLFNDKAREDLTFYAVLGVVLGGRIGYVLFYNLPHYLAYPLDIAKVWQGGMSFHGGLFGVMAAFYLFCRRHQLPYVRVMDYLALVAPIGLFLGRLANFINGELYGRVTDASWGMIFPHGGPLPRYPSQLMEAASEGLLLFLILLAVALRGQGLRYAGRMSGVFLTGYALARMGCEIFREPDTQLGVLFLGVTMGQLLCLPMLAGGVYLLATSGMRTAFSIYSIIIQYIKIVVHRLLLRRPLP